MATVDAPKRARAAHLIAEALEQRRRLDALRAELPKDQCRDCAGVMFQHRVLIEAQEGTPVACVLHKCRICGSWNEITITAP